MVVLSCHVNTLSLTFFGAGGTCEVFAECEKLARVFRKITTIASHHLGHTRYSANSQIVVHRVIYLGLCGYILQEEPYSKQCTKSDLPMMIHC